MENNKKDNLIEDITFRDNEKLFEHLKTLSANKISELHNSIFSENHSKNQTETRKILYKISPKDNSYNSSIDLKPGNTSNQANSRICALEKRLEKSEKLLKYFEEILKLKDVERDNDIKTDRNKIADLSKRIIFLEENIRNFHKKLSSITDVFNEKFNSIEKKIQSVLSKKDDLSGFYSNKLNDVENILKKNESLIDNTVENKLNDLRVSLDSK